MFHYMDRDGFNAIRSRPDWLFKAFKPPAEHPPGAYFTTLGRDTRNLAQRLGIPKSKTEFYFEFTDAGDLQPLRGDRGEFIFYSPVDYEVVEVR